MCLRQGYKQEDCMAIRNKLPALLLIAAVMCLAEAACSPRPDTQMVHMRDGIRLATDCFIPRATPAPVILVRTVYGRSDKSYRKTARSLKAAGIGLVVQDTRGRFGSEGTDRVFLDDAWGELQDGADTVAWLRSQPWCNGIVTTMGGSALGITQILMAPATQNIAGQLISVACASLYSVAYIGGVWNKSLVEGWTAGQGNDYMLQTWREHPRQDAFWDQLDAEAQAGRVTAPAVHTGGWWDIFQQGTINNFTSRQYGGGAGARGNQFLIMGPWAHSREQKLGDLTLPGNYEFPQPDLEWMLMQYWLNGTGPEVMQKQRVHYYVLGDVENAAAPGNVWRTADDWPPLETRPLELYLWPSHALSTALAAEAVSYTYTFDPANPCPTHGGANLNLPAGPFDQRQVSSRSDVISFATAPLTEPVEATGRISVRLFVQTTAVDTDFAAKLVDIYPDGREILLVDGIQRLKYRSGGVAPAPVTPGETAELTVDLWSFSVIFNTGHRIGVQISSSNYPRFEVNPNTGADFPDTAGMVTSANTILIGPDHPSALILPVPKN
jgi:hypothetical protein